MVKTNSQNHIDELNADLSSHVEQEMVRNIKFHKPHIYECTTFFEHYCTYNQSMDVCKNSCGLLYVMVI